MGKTTAAAQATNGALCGHGLVGASWSRTASAGLAAEGGQL
jgi:hypothetical protein